MVSKQKHDLGRQKRAWNTLHNPAALSKTERVAKRNSVRVMSAFDLFHKEGRWPRGWERRDAGKPDRATGT
jgi:hypothetical protein